ncbi:MAG: hypothetical protein R6W68_06380 [Ignavibacteriaceae bacterium]
MKNYKKSQPEIKITLIYFVLGFLWILFSGKMAYNLSEQSEVIVTLERYKGWFFILVTGILLYLLIKRESDKQNNLLKQLSGSREDLLNKSKILQQQNKQLREVAFITSHNLRRPVANILGLIQLIDIEKNINEENKSTLVKISEQAEELDHLIRVSNSFLETNDEGKDEQ